MKKINEKFIRDFCERHNVEIQREGAGDGKTINKVLYLSHCPFNEAHIDGDARLLIGKTVRFKCHHDECIDKKLPDFIKKYEPDFYKDSGVNDSKGSVKKASREDVLAAVKRAKDVEEKEIEWLIPGLLVRSDVNIIGAEGGSGKGFMTASLLAGVTCGKMPEVLRSTFPFEMDPETVLYLTSEDSAEQVLRPRWRAAGADLDKIQLIDKGSEILQNISFSDENGTLDILLEELKPSLVVFDPIQSFLPERVRLAERNQVRRCLNHLSVLSAKYGTTFLLLMHFNKRETTDARKALADSSDMWDLARSVMFVGNADDNGLKYFSQEKTNYSEISNTTLFRINDDLTLSYAGTTEKRFHQFEEEKKAAQNTNNNGPTARSDAKAYIVQLLKRSKDNMMLTEELNEICTANGISKNTLGRAKTDLANDGIIKTERMKEFGGKFYTTLLNTSVLLLEV